MAGRLLDTDPEVAYEHAQAAVRRAGRVDVVREAAGIAAYRTGRYAEALRELRTVRRLNGSDEHLPLMADCERGLGRPERALALAKEEAAGRLDAAGRLEMALVVAGARLDLGQPEAALVALAEAPAATDAGTRDRAAAVRVAVLEALGRHDEAAALASSLPPGVLVPDDDADVVVFDLEQADGEGDGPDVSGGVTPTEGSGGAGDGREGER